MFAIVAIKKLIKIADGSQVYREVLEIHFARDKVLPSNGYHFRAQLQHPN